MGSWGGIEPQLQGKQAVFPVQERSCEWQEISEDVLVCL